MKLRVKLIFDSRDWLWLPRFHVGYKNLFLMWGWSYFEICWSNR